MQALLTPLTVGISEFKKNPSESLRKAKGAPIAVLSHNEPAFYVVQPEVMQGFADALTKQEFAVLIRGQRVSAKQAKADTLHPDIDKLTT
jgi:antitoxin StbD